VTLVFAAIAPHGAPALDDAEGETRRGFEELGRRFEAAAPDATIVFTPHGVLVEDHFGVALTGRYWGDVSEWSDSGIELSAPGDPALARVCLDGLRAAGLPAVGFTFGSSLADTATMPLDWGALIPLWFMGRDRVPAVVVTPTRALPIGRHVEAGRALGRVAEQSGNRIALIASADHGHGQAEDGPYGFAAESADYDERVVAIVRGNRLADLLDFEPAFVGAALADSWWQLAMLHGALGDGWRGELISYEVPTYFGMLCAAYEPA
jgi:aromatic ring-opening dioxygenase LigB subunit